MRGDMFNKMHGPIVHERLLEMNQMSAHPIHALEAKPKPMIIYGWVERRAEEKALEKATSEQNAAPPASSPPDLRVKADLRGPYTDRFKRTAEYQKIKRNSDRLDRTAKRGKQ